MTPKQVLLKIKGMQRDLSDSSFRNDYAYENKNIRITADSDNGLLSITTEKSTKEINLKKDDLILNRLDYYVIEGNEPGTYTYILKLQYPTPEDEGSVSVDVSMIVTDVDYSFDPVTDTLIIEDVEKNDGEIFIAGINTSNKYKYYSLDDIVSGEDTEDIALELLFSGKCIGVAEIGDSVILFYTKDSIDGIILLTGDNDKFTPTLLFVGNLNFDVTHPIETLVDIENENIQKVYWVDGINQPRVINIKGDIKHNDSKQFDFIPEIESGTIKVKSSEVSGQFPAGVIQYAFTYFNKFGQESSVVDVSPIYYLAEQDRGAKVNTVVNKSFKISFERLDTSWEYVRIYSIVRTSVNTTPEVRKVADLRLNEASEFIDTGTSGEYIAPTDLLYKGGEVLAASTITSKDNTLFLGNLETKDSGIVSDELINSLRTSVEFKFDNSIRTLYKIGERPIHMSGAFNSNDSVGQFYTYYNHLKYSNRDITTFKYGETYRIGIQLQNIYGKWCNPIYLGDYTNECLNGNIPKNYIDEYAGITITTGSLEVSNRDIINDLKEAGYIKIRPVIVYPEENDRSVLCQGVLCPTVFNTKDRLENSPYSQSSWFIRPNKPTTDNSLSPDKPPLSTDNTQNKKSGVYAESEHYAPIGGYSGKDSDNKYYIPDNAEFPSIPLGDVEALPKEDNDNNYFVDQHIITLHSPDIEFNTNMSTTNFDNYKLRIVGYVPITANRSSYSIQGEVSTRGTDPKPGEGEVSNMPFRSYNKSVFGFRHLVNGNLFADYIYTNNILHDALYTVYPWNYSDHKQIIDETKDSWLSYHSLNKVRMYNYQFSSNSIYFNEPITAEKKCESVKYADNTPIYFNNKFYYSEVDKLHFVNIPYESGVKVNINELNDYATELPNKDEGVYKTPESVYVFKNQPLKTIPVTYKSTKHVVIKLPVSDKGEYEYETSLYDNQKADDYELWAFWNYSNNTIQKKTKLKPLVKPANILSEYGFLLLGELYKEVDEEVRFGGTSDYALQNNLWVPCGQAVDISDIIIKGPLLYTEGDTYYQRYDHIKTLPRNDQDLNGVTSVISFMCETRINLDGKYSDREVFVENPNLITEDNFNKLNTVYSQQNNFFNYRILDSKRFGFNSLPNTITWTKTKHANAVIDEWLNINLASSIDLDGNKGKVTALKKFSDNIVAFQNKGISTILFNSRVQITPSDNIPIEIANSGKVDGYRYISDKVGCFNKYSICESPNGIYFIDDYNKALYVFNSELNNISDSKGFHSFMMNNCKLNIWNPKDFNNVVTYRDSINKEIMFIYKDFCLAYNEILGEFSSFYSYENVPYMFNLGNRVILIANDGTLHIKNGGDTYGEFFGKTEDSYIEYIINDNPTYDKIFSTIDMRADVLDSNNKLVLDNNTLIKPFNYLKVSNEYQESISNLEGKEFIPKFRTWRAQFPRVGKDRIRNNWIRLKIGNINRTNFNHKVRLHDVVVNYFI